ncbi:MAG: hypothetical protein KDE33_12550 [Bacteroidetes bacterium]|nr:hypothetical protein [Bacteroidota bacterium]
MRKSKIRFTTLLFVLLIPLFFINIADYHYWGGDFSQYIFQAQNVCNGINQGEQFYVYNPNYSELAPQAYPPGFPLLLAPAVCYFNTDYSSLFTYMSIFFILNSIVWFILIAKFEKPWISFVVVLLASYLPWMLDFKLNILSDIPFSLFFALSIILFLKLLKSKHKFILSLLLACCVGFTILIKTMGFALSIAFIVYVFYAYFVKKRYQLKDLAFITFSAVLSVVIYKIGTALLLKNVEGHVEHFASFFFEEEILERFLNNLFYYYTTYRHFLSLEGSLFNFPNALFIDFLIICTLLGFILTFKNYKTIKITEFIFGIFVIVVALFPYYQGYRYILALTPIFFIYMIRGISLIQQNIKIKPFFIFIIILLSYLLPLRIYLVKSAKTISASSKYVENIETQETFNYIKNNTTIEDTIIFIKPRVLALYTHRYSASNYPYYNNLEEIKEDVESLHANYIIQSKEIMNYATQLYIDSVLQKKDTTFYNNSFVIYRIN